MNLFYHTLNTIDKSVWINFLSTKDLWRFTLTNKYLHTFVTHIKKDVHSIVHQKGIKYPLRNKYCYYSLAKPSIPLSDYLTQCLCGKIYIYKIKFNNNVCHCILPIDRIEEKKKGFCYTCYNDTCYLKCYQCHHDEKYTCDSCHKIGTNESFFSYSKICWGCDMFAHPQGSNKCYFCHRGAIEEYDGKLYCNWCI